MAIAAQPLVHRTRAGVAHTFGAYTPIVDSPFSFFPLILTRTDYASR